MNTIVRFANGAPLTISLLDNGTPLANRTIVFTINGVDYNRVTNNKGKASLNINLLPGTYPTTVHFVGDGTYNSQTSYCIVRVISNSIPQKEIKQDTNYFEVNKINLYVLTKNGFDVKPGQNIKETTLLHDSANYNSPTFYFNSGFDGDEFEISIVIRETDFYNTEQVMSILNSWNKTNMPVSVVTDAMVIANGKYTMQIKDKKQTNKLNSIWELRFKQYYENSLSFESMYDRKTSTLSALDLLLLKQVNGINKNSPREVITALQKKLNVAGYWAYPQDTYGLWNGVATMIYRFQYDVMHVQDRWPGFDGVDYETITELIDYTGGGVLNG